LKGTIHDSGTISVQSFSPFAPSALVLDAGGVTLDGGGTVALNDAPWNSIRGGTLTNVDHLISGAGTISANVVNKAGGTIASFASQSAGNQLITSAATVSNAGELQGRGNQDLVLSHSQITQTGAGEVNALGGNVD